MNPKDFDDPLTFSSSTICGEISPQLLDGFPRNLVHMIMFHSGINLEKTYTHIGETGTYMFSIFSTSKDESITKIVE